MASRNSSKQAKETTDAIKKSAKTGSKNLSTGNDVISPDFREQYLADIIATIEDEQFMVDNSIKSQSFTRKRKLPFTLLIVFITQGLSRSIQRELNSFYQKLRGTDFSIQEVTKSALSHARAKLKPEAFIQLNQAGLQSFYKNAPYLKWNNFRLLAIDGSTAVLPNHPSVIQEFGTTNFGPNADSTRSVARISMLYDVLNLTVLNAEIDGYTVSERDQAKKHFPLLQPGKDLVIMDRGYPSLRLMFELQSRKVDYCIRMHDNWWLEVKKMLDVGESDKIVKFKLADKDSDLLEAFHADNGEIECRLVIITLPNGSREVLCTSLKDKEAISIDVFKSLYHHRWNIEEGYKLYKTRLQLEAFSGKTAQAVKQDFYAKVFMMTTAAVLAFPIEQQLKKEQEDSSRQHKYKVNRTNSLALTKESSVNVFIKKLIRPAINMLDKILKKTAEIVRPNRKNPRKKSTKKPPSMNYKQL